MRPTLHPRLVNGRFGDPALFVEMLHRRGALLFDIGDVSALSARDLLRVEAVFVTHTHIDHFIGFDALLRLCVGREKRVRLVGPPGFADKLFHKLQAYEWDLVDRYDVDLVFEALEFDGLRAQASCFRFKNQFQWEELGSRIEEAGLVGRGSGYSVHAAMLEHHGPCLGFAMSEPRHINIWKNRLEERGLSTGPWLQPLKLAMAEDRPDDFLLQVPGSGEVRLGDLRDLASVEPGQKIVYIADVADTPDNRATIIELAAGADMLVIEARFAAADHAQAAERAHLTTKAAGEIARAAGVRRIEPFHFSPRYEGDEERMMREVLAAFGS
jgi:ribonuclease Z